MHGGDVHGQPVAPVLDNEGEERGHGAELDQCRTVEQVERAAEKRLEHVLDRAGGALRAQAYHY